MKLLPKGQQPYVKASKQAEDILDQNHDLFIRHWRTWKRCDGSEAIISKAFSEDERFLIGSINEELLFSGYRVDRVTDTGEIIWLVMTENQEYVERRQATLAKSLQGTPVIVTEDQNSAEGSV